MELTRNFKYLNRTHADLAGGKGASLGEMTQAGIPVPPGFVVLSESFEQFLRETDLNVEIDSILHTVKHQEIHTVEGASEKIQILIKAATMPADIATDIDKQFDELATEYVAVRSSATAEDGAEHAWAGQLDSFLNVKKDQVLHYVQHCWASLFTPRAIFYRFEKGLHSTKISVAVVVQKMVNSEISGIAFSVHPVTEDYNQLIIEAGFGLGEAIVSGQITPDSYVVEKEPRNIIDTNISTQERALYRVEGGGNEWQTIPEPKASSQVLTVTQILELSEIILGIEKHYGFPCDIEWAWEGGKFYIVQSRPITTLQKLEPMSEKTEDDELLNKIKSADWKYLVNRREALLFRSFTTHCYKYFKEVTGIDWQASMEFRPEADLLYSAKELGDLAKKLADGGEGLLQSFYDCLVKYVQEYDDLAHIIAKNDFASAGSSVLLENLVAYKEAALRMHNFLLPMPIADQVISKMLLTLLPTNVSEEKRQRWLSVLAYPALENEHTKEERSFYNLAKEYQKKSDDFDRLLTAHLEEFSWIGARWYFWHNAWNKSDIIARLDEFFDQGKNPEEELEHLNHIRLEREEESQRIFKELDIPEDIALELKNLVKLAKMYAHARTWRTDVAYRAGFLARNLFEEIATRVGFEKTDPQYMAIFELEELAKGNSTVVSKEIIAKRREFYGSVLIDGQYVIFAGNEWRERLQGLYVKDKATADSEIVGTVAYHGKAKGRVKVVHQTEEIGKVNRGDILVAVMTFPNLIPAMEKAAAFVTDEGGILCHAAIVSREMKKPCVIGTKIATQVLKDGDIVEVDAEKGVIKKLNIFNPNDFNRMFASKAGFIYIYSDIFLQYYAQLGVLSIQDGGSWMSFFSKEVQKRTLEEGKKLYTSKELYEKYRQDFQEYIATSTEQFEKVLAKEILSAEEVQEFLQLAARHFSYYSKTEFFYTDSIDQSEMVLTVQEFDKLKLDGRSYLNKILFEEDGFVRSLIKKISLQANVSELDLFNYTIQEMVEVVQNAKKVNAEVIQNRATFFASENLNLFGGEAKPLAQEFLATYQEISTIIKGVIANKGRARGKARVLVPDFKDFSKIALAVEEMQEGEILIAETTAPEIIKACKKAAAIVTNQGGMLSHAAIISRELKIPCIVGTDKDVLLNIKTGDEIEVDADTGVVKILK